MVVSCQPPELPPSLEEFVHDRLEPLAMAMDESVSAVRQGLEYLRQEQTPWLAPRLRVLRKDPGFENPLLAYRWQERLTQASGTLAFLQTQHQSACVFLHHSPNLSLKNHYLEAMAQGKRWVGVGFAHLRRPQVPLQAEVIPGGYCLRGEAPWVSGWGFFEGAIVAAQLPTGDAVYGWVPFGDHQQPQGGSLRCSQPWELASLDKTQTVRLEFHNYELPEAAVVMVQRAGALAQRDRQGVLGGSLFPLGNAQAGLGVLEQAHHDRSDPMFQRVIDHLQRELTQLRGQIYGGLGAIAAGDVVTEELYQTYLRWRGEAIILASRCTHAAIVAHSGAANDRHHPAQRVYRETLMFTVSGQSPMVQTATLAQLLPTQNPKTFP